MKIDIWAAAHSVGQNENRRTACALVLLATAPDGRVCTRKMVFALGSSTLNLAQLQAVRLGLLAIRPWAVGKKLPLSVHVESTYVSDMLAKRGDGYVARPHSNAPAVTAMRELVERTPWLAMDYGDGDGIGNGCAQLARDAATSQVSSDSGTKEFPSVQAAEL